MAVPYETGEIYTTGKQPAEQFELKAIVQTDKGIYYPTHKWVAPARELASIESGSCDA